MIDRVAYISLHTSPLEQPGVGDAGGMNVYIKELAATMARRGVGVDVFTRRNDDDLPEVVEPEPGYRVVHVDAGPSRRLPVSDLPEYVAEFADGVIKWGYTEGAKFDVVHSHYWLSGWAGVLVKDALSIPLANSFHTLGRVKDLTRRADDAPTALFRIATERDVIALSDCVVASTEAEAADLLEHYDADPERLCTSPPGIDHAVFCPGDRRSARRRLEIEEGPLVVFAGRIQPLKGLDVAVAALGHLRSSVPAARLLVVGGASGPAGQAEVIRLRAMADDMGVSDAITWVPPQPHEQLVDYYRAADVVIVPSRSESFGLVAAEAQSCAIPVVAANVGGLAYTVDDGASGFLIDGWEPGRYAAAIARILADPGLAARLGAGALDFSQQFSWQATADRLLELYDGISGR